MLPLPDPKPLWRIVAIVAGILLIYAGAKVNITLPGYPVPQTAQTLAVVIVAVLLAPVDGVIAVTLYVLAGALGVPVFAGSEAGVQIISGPSGGFLAGFVLASAFLGFWTHSGRSGRFAALMAGMLTAHAIILVSGGIRLATMYGIGTAWTRGVVPYLGGALIKSVVAALVVYGVIRMLRNYELLPEQRKE